MFGEDRDNKGDFITATPMILPSQSIYRDYKP